MTLPDWRRFAFVEGVLPEKGGADDRIVLWVRADARNWCRVSSIPNARIEHGDDLHYLPATSVSMRKRGIISAVIGAFRRDADAVTWYHPQGHPMNETGKRLGDRVLVWARDAQVPIDEKQIRAHWPRCQEIQRLAPNFILVSGIEIAVDETSLDAQKPLPLARSPREMAESLIQEARQKGDGRAETTALIDLGSFLNRERDSASAAPILQQALANARRIGDKTCEIDALGTLGMAFLRLDQGALALQCFQEERVLAERMDSRFALKTALKHLAAHFSKARDPHQAIAHYQRAVVIANEVGDTHGESELLWDMAIQYAALGQREEALTAGQQAVHLMRKLKNPGAAAFLDHLEKYRSGTMDARAEGSPQLLANSLAAETAQVQPNPQPPAQGPGLLLMAYSAATALTRFVGSGLQTVSPDLHRKRLDVCGNCEHHTGIRCKVCGCFTSIKTRLPHERCPLGKWLA